MTPEEDGFALFEETWQVPWHMRFLYGGYVARHQGCHSVACYERMRFVSLGGRRVLLYPRLRPRRCCPTCGRSDAAGASDFLRRPYRRLRSPLAPIFPPLSLPRYYSTPQRALQRLFRAGLTCVRVKKVLASNLEERRLRRRVAIVAMAPLPPDVRELILHLARL